MPDLADVPWLSLLLLFPLAGALVAWVGRLRGTSLRVASLLFSLPPLLISLQLLLDIGVNLHVGLGYEEQYAWIPGLGATIHLGVDGISMPMVFLTALMFPLVFLYSWDVTHREREYHILFLLLEFAVLGVFLALDYFLFYVFWEIVLVPMFLIILIWGGENRKYAAIKFFAYTFLASLVMLLGILALYFRAAPILQYRTFDMAAIASVNGTFSPGFQALVFGALFIGFAVKMPTVPFHTWLPDAHVQAPTGGSVILAALLLKMGAYGFFRVSLPTLPLGAEAWVPAMATIGIVSIVYGAFLALAQQDLKSMIAYSSISHMGAVLLGIATLNTLGLTGALYLMLAHGLISAMLFISAGVVQHHAGTRLIDRLGGLANAMPVASAITLFAYLASLGLPGLAGFVAELTILLGTFAAFGWLVVPVAATLVVTAGYYLWAMQRAYHGPLRPGLHPHGDLTWYEFVPMFVLALATLALGLWPQPIIDSIGAASATLLAQMGVA